MEPSFEAEILASLKEDLEIYNDMILEVSAGLMRDEISKYPIFIAHKEVLSIGRLIIDHEVLATEWSISGSHLEEFAIKKIILEENVEAFKKIYKNPLKQICLFVIHDGSANFIFSPYR